MPEFPIDVVADIRAALLAFFDGAGRDLPWRRSADPYAIWISEVMLQQTRVEAVVPYYQRWLGRFPDVHALAQAPVDDVLKAWEGLGYYSRARNLHAAAQAVRERHGGAVPSDYGALRALPGIGDYTAGAITSIAYGAREPAVDGNARRVLARLLDEPAPTAKRVRAVAAALVPHDRPGDFNQALMELGATICTPRAPKCARCPLQQHCRARAAGTQLERPLRIRQKPIPEVHLVCVVLRRTDDGSALLVRRPARGLLAGMWTFPARELNDGETAAAGADALAGEYACALAPPRVLGIVEHTFSHRRDRYECFRVSVAPPDATSEAMWIGPDATGIALPRAQQRIHQLAFGAEAEVGAPRG